MSMFSRIGHTSRLVAAAAVSFSLLAGVAAAQNGYVEVRVRDDNTGCGPVVIKWPMDQEEREYDPNPGANDPKLEMAETQPLPVIHHHPALNAGSLYLPPQDGIYRHYFPESEAPPRLRRWDRPEYEEYLREQNPSTDVPFAVGGIAEGLAFPAGVAIPAGIMPSTVYVPTGLTTPPAAFTGAPGGYVAAPDVTQVAYVPASEMTSRPAAAPTTPTAPAAPVAARPPVPPAIPGEEGTGSFIHLSSIAEQVPFLGSPAGNAMLQSLLEESPAAPASAAPAPVMVPAAIPAPVSTTVPATVPAVGGSLVSEVADFGIPAPLPAFVEPGDESSSIGRCGTPVCR